MKKRLLLLLAIAVFTLGAVACSGSKESENNSAEISNEASNNNNASSNNEVNALTFEQSIEKAGKDFIQVMNDYTVATTAAVEEMVDTQDADKFLQNYLDATNVAAYEMTEVQQLINSAVPSSDDLVAAHDELKGIIFEVVSFFADAAELGLLDRESPVFAVKNAELQAKSEALDPQMEMFMNCIMEITGLTDEDFLPNE